VLKLTVAVLATALAGAANAAGWRSLRLDAHDEASFKKSVAAFEEQLTPARRYAFKLALKDIWNQGTRAAAADQREFTATDYLRQLDGLGYEQVVTFTDPSGKTARRYRAAYNPYVAGDAGGGTGSAAPPAVGYRQPTEYRPVGHAGEQLHGSPDPIPPRP
jgi:hypothetical protein